ncbi:MAG: hypothetical protein ACI8YQ_001252 [Polaribacter sp.]|jgi:hypothetical protein
MKKKSQVAFALGTGRCGTNFLYELIDRSKNTVAYHEQNPLSDAFIRYASWYQLPIDLSSCWDQKSQIIREAHQKGKDYFESSAYLSLSIPKLYTEHDARFILLIRHPRAVVQSYFTKGWYEVPMIRNAPELPPAIQPELEKPHHYFSRIVAYGNEGQTWSHLSRVGKLAWFWKTINSAVIAKFQALPEEQYRIIRLEDFTYEVYQEVASFLNVESLLTERAFNKIADSKPNKSKKKQSSIAWTEEEEEEFREYVGELSAKFKYEL